MDKSILVDQNYLQLLKRIFSCFLHELCEQLQIGQEIYNGNFFMQKMFSKLLTGPIKIPIYSKVCTKVLLRFCKHISWQILTVGNTCTVTDNKTIKCLSHL